MVGSDSSHMVSELYSIKFLLVTAIFVGKFSRLVSSLDFDSSTFSMEWRGVELCLCPPTLLSPFDFYDSLHSA